MKKLQIPVETKKAIAIRLVKYLLKNIAIFCMMVLVISGVMFAYMYLKDNRKSPVTSHQKLNRLCHDAEKEMQRTYNTPEGQKYLEELRLTYEMNCK
jgi:hypothetical protein